MVNTVDSNRQLEGALHYDPDAYWCPRCWKFTKDCQHLVKPLTTRLVQLDDWLIRAVRYDRDRQILEVHLHAGGTYQDYEVPLDLALRIAKSSQPGRLYQREVMNGKFRFERVRRKAVDQVLENR